MLSFLVALGLIVGIVSGCVSIYEFIRSRQGRGIVYAVVAVCLILAAVLLASFPSGVRNVGTNPGSTGNTQPTTGNTSAQITPTMTAISTPSTPTTPPTPTPTAQSILPYTADWSHGPNGWPVTDIWRVYGNALHCSGTGDIAFPFQLGPGPSGTTDYTVEWKATAQGGDYGITVRAGNDGSDYGYHISFNNGDINQVTWLYIFKGGGHIYGDIQKQYTVPSGSHDYIVTVKANIITIKVDGATILTKEDNSFVTGGSTSFTSGGTQVDITYVKVTQA